MKNIIIMEKNKDFGCFYIKKEKQKENRTVWLEKEISLHAFLIFLICLLGTVFVIGHYVDSARNGKKIWLASTISSLDSDSDENFDVNQNIKKIDIEPQFIKLPVSNNAAYKLPLSPEKEKPKEEKPPEEKPIPKKIISKPPVKNNNSKAVFNKEEYKNGKYLEIDISDQSLKIYGSGELKGLYKVSTGMKGFPTPLGNFSVLRKSANVWSRDYGCWMPYSLEFTAGLFIHELPYWPGGQREGEGHLGIPVSHGCVRLGIGPAKEVYDFADIGTPVIIHQ